MTVAELIERLKRMPQHAQIIFVEYGRDDEQYILLSAEPEFKLEFTDDRGNRYTNVVML